MKFRHLAIAVALIAAFPASAQMRKRFAWGTDRNAGPYHVELVAKDTASKYSLATITTNRSIQGFKGVAIFNLGGKAERITLAPSEGDAFERNGSRRRSGQSQRGGSGHGTRWHDLNRALRLTRHDGALACR